MILPSGTYVKAESNGDPYYGWVVDLRSTDCNALIELDEGKHRNVGHSAIGHVPITYIPVQGKDYNYWFVERDSVVVLEYPAIPNPEHSYKVSSKKSEHSLQVGDSFIDEV